MSAFRALVLLFLSVSVIYVVQECALLVPPSVTRQFLDPPARVVISLATVGGRTEFLNYNLPSLFNQVGPG